VVEGRLAGKGARAPAANIEAEQARIGGIGDHKPIPGHRHAVGHAQVLAHRRRAAQDAVGARIGDEQSIAGARDGVRPAQAFGVHRVRRRRAGPGNGVPHEHAPVAGIRHVEPAVMKADPIGPLEASLAEDHVRRLVGSPRQSEP
jgi:hypothetical protein